MKEPLARPTPSGSRADLVRAGDGRPSRREVVAGMGALLASACASGRAGRALPVPLSLPLVYDDRGGLFLDASVGGAPARLILDTGASRSTLSEGFVRELGLATREGGEVEGTAGVVAAREATAQLEIPGIDPLRIEFLVYGFGSYDPLCRGILGYELLHRAPFQIRYREQVLAWNAALPAERLPLALDGRIPRVAVRVNGEPIELRIDTGATLPPSPTAYVNLSAWQAERLGLTGQPEKVFTATGTGGATLELPVHRLESIQVGSALLRDAFAIVQPRVGYFARGDAVGFLGNSVLDELDPYLDYAGRWFATAGGQEPPAGGV